MDSAKLYTPEGGKDIAPANGQDFQLKELQDYVGGYIELVPLPDGTTLVVNEEGKLLGLPANRWATLAMNMAGRDGDLVGNVVHALPGQLL